ncbi:ATP-binding protein [Streptomyces sp. NPDC102402]|uniref:ATP-binding protein n=1 Tax=Streptomyces sp. NPDC102402 TaxID=3366169 RepID=UPI0038168286
MNGSKITIGAAPSTPSTSSAPRMVRGGNTESIHRAREAARGFACGLVPAPDSDTVDTLVLVVSELATNALRHGGGRYSLELSATTDAMTAAISDPSPVPPCERAPDLNGGSGGFGWHMVRRLTTDLTVTPGPGAGKTIRARLSRLGT